MDFVDRPRTDRHHHGAAGIYIGYVEGVVHRLDLNAKLRGAATDGQRAMGTGHEDTSVPGSGLFSLIPKNLDRSGRGESHPDVGPSVSTEIPISELGAPRAR